METAPYSNSRCCNPRRWLVLATVLVLQVPSDLCADEPARFYRGLNLNGPALTIDGHRWQGQEATNYLCKDKAFENQTITLKPATDHYRARMIRSSRWGNPGSVTLNEIPSGDYQVFVYVWEDNNSTRFDVSLNGQSVLSRYESGAAGSWAKLGPWKVAVTDGVIRLGTSGGDANLSGIEVWAGAGPIPEEKSKRIEVAAIEPTPAGIEFFEKRIRPVLVQKCYECHSAQSDEVAGGLVLDSRPGMLSGGVTEPAIKPGDVEASLLIKAVRYNDPALKMPPGGKLAAAEIADLESWVKLGAPDPRTQAISKAAKKPIDLVAAREFWSFRPVQSPRLPEVMHSAWVKSPIDRFILQKLELHGLTPAPPADRRTLIRRATFDLIGLPPTPDEVAAFLADDSATAFDKVIERLLASPHYGERWGRHWLDVVRYADTAGDNSDYPIPQLYKYRNWVIGAFNDDKPYDEFIHEQLAGDLLPHQNEQDRHEKLIATGYLANSKRFGSYEDARYPWHLTIEDTIDNLGRTFLALTINCTRCHDHKFDPLTNADYYALYGFFSSTRYPWPGIELDKAQRDLVPLAAPDEVAAIQHQRQREQKAFDARIEKLEEEQKAANDGLKEAEGDADEARKQARIAALTKQLATLKQAIKTARKEREDFIRQPVPYELAYAVAEGQTEGNKKVGNACIQIKGDPLRPGPEVPRRFISVLGGQLLPEEVQGSGRLHLARWITDPGNPLTARVMVNRIWHYHFGKGIVATPSDFGKQGTPPTHPELLDYLAVQLVEQGWSIKAMHRLIMRSNAYQMSSSEDASISAKDVNNDLLWHFRRQRLDAESIRDSLLAVSGNLEPAPRGGHPFPEQKSWDFTQHKPFKAVYDSHARSVYLMTQRFQRHPFLSLFDGADTNASTATRTTSTTPLQALYLMNDPFVHQQAEKFAARMLAERSNDAARIELAYLLLFARPPEVEEQRRALEYLAQVLEKQGDLAPSEQSARAWESLARALWMSNEFVYLN